MADQATTVRGIRKRLNSFNSDKMRAVSLDQQRTGTLQKVSSNEKSQKIPQSYKYKRSKEEEAIDVLADYLPDETLEYMRRR